MAVLGTDDEGSALTGNVLRFNFVGAGVTATNSSGNITVTIPGGLSGLTSGKLLIGNASNVATEQSVTGDATLSNAGVLTITNDAVTLAKLAADAVNSSKIADGTIALADLAGDSVDSAKIVDATITNADVSATAAIIYSKLNLNNAIVLADLTTDSVNSSKIVDGSIVAADLAVDAVTSAKVLDGTLTNADISASAAIALSKLASGTTGQIIVANASGVPTYVALSGDATIDNAGLLTIANLAVTNAKLANDAVTSTKILDGTIATADLADSSVTLIKLAGDSVNSSKIVDGSIVAADIATGTITTTQIADGTIALADLASNSIDTTKIVDATITNADISATAAIALSKLADGTNIITSLTTPTGSNANGGSIASNVLTLSLADGTNPGLVSTGAQTFAGNKTFSNNVTVSGALSADGTNTSTNVFTQGGNTFGAQANLGTNDSNILALKTGGASRFEVQAGSATLQGQGATTISSTSTLDLSSFASSALRLGSNQTTGSTTIGGTTQTGAINIATGTGDQQVNLATGAANKTVTIGNNMGSTTISLVAGTGNINFSGNAVVNSGNILKFNNAANTFGTSFVAGNNTSNIAYTLPIVAPTAGQVLSSTAGGVLSWASGGATPLSGLIAASATNTIDNLNFAQNWNWSTATTQTGLTMNANALTTGGALAITSSSAALNSTNGLLYVANTGAVTNGTIARIQSNSTAGSGLTVNANGRVGIGTTAPASALAIQGDGFTSPFNTGLILNNTGTSPRSFMISSRSDGVNGARLALSDETAGAVRLTLGTNGFFGIGTEGPGSKMHLAGDGNSNFMDSSIRFQNTGASGRQWNVGSRGDAGGGNQRFSITDETATTERLGIDQDGKVFAGEVVGNTMIPGLGNAKMNLRTASGHTLNLRGQPADVNIMNVYAGVTGDITYIQFLTDLGGVGTARGIIRQQGANVNFGNASDERLKIDTGKEAKGLDELLKIKVRNYDWKGIDENSDGFFAQELHKIVPNAVSVGDDELDQNGNLKNPWMVDYGKLTPILAKSIQDLNFKVENGMSSVLTDDLAAWTEVGAITSRINSVKTGESRDVAKYFADKMSEGYKFVTDFASEKVTAIVGYFDTVFAKEATIETLCVGTKDAKTCITKDQLDTMLNAQNIAPVIINISNPASDTNTENNGGGSEDQNNDTSDTGDSSNSTETPSPENDENTNTDSTDEVVPVTIPTPEPVVPATE